jgi:ribosomal protein S18 acetylase RimI-like enzyme
MIEHSEHRMRLTREPAESNNNPLVTVRELMPADGPFLISCLAEAFAQPAERFENADYDVFTKRFPGTFIIDYADERVGTVRVDRHEGAADIYGFAVLPKFQGGGIERQVLSSLARDLAEEGVERVERVELAVSCTNDGALHLYLSSGFDVMGTEDYYGVSLGSAKP